MLVRLHPMPAGARRTTLRRLGVHASRLFFVVAFAIAALLSDLPSSWTVADIPTVITNLRNWIASLLDLVTFLQDHGKFPAHEPEADLRTRLYLEPGERLTVNPPLDGHPPLDDPHDLLGAVALVDPLVLHPEPVQQLPAEPKLLLGARHQRAGPDCGSTGYQCPSPPSRARSRAAGSALAASARRVSTPSCRASSPAVTPAWPRVTDVPGPRRHSTPGPQTDVRS